MQKGKLLALVMALVLMLAAAASAGAAVAYDYRLPDGYDANKDVKYPVVYILPQDGYAKDTSAIYDKFKDAMANGTGMDMILVKPQFEKGMDLNAELDALVAVVDGKFNTVADPAYRTLIGTGTGGYLAYALGLNSTTFGNLASINGNFVDNPWYATYGDVLKQIKSIGSAGLKKYYTYMDAPVDGTWTNMESSSNDIGQVMIDYDLLQSQNEYTVRPGVYDNAFVTESVNRVANRLTSNMFGSLISGSVSLEKSVVTKDDKNIVANYTVKIGNALSTFVGGEVNADVIVTVDDGKGTSKKDSGKAVSAGSTLTGSFTLANNAAKTCTVNLSVNIMGAKFDVASANLIVSQDPNADVVDLMGDWHFNFLAKNYADMTALSTGDSWKSWAIGQPGLDWWALGFADFNASHPLVGSMASSPYFGYLLVGSGYYARNFYVPADFKIDGAKLVLGYIDDYDEVFINGVRIGGIGIDEDGTFSGNDASWSMYRAYELGNKEDVIKLGATNTIVVRCHNRSMGGGGWYEGPIGLYSADAYAEIGSDPNDPHFYESSFESKYAASALGQSGTIDNKFLIYLPEDYYESDRYYPTMYLMHQYGSDHNSYRTDKINKLMDEGAAAGLFDEMIVVIPNSEGSSWWSGDWLKMVSEELVPFIDENYRTIPDARYRFTAGCSMGGQGAFGVALQNPDLFTGAISFFGAFSMGGNASPNTIAAKESAEYMDYFSMYFICGNKDIYQFGIPAIELNQQLDEIGVDHFFLVDNGEHNSVFYLPHFQEAVAYTRDNMYDDTNASAKKLVKVMYSATEDTLTSTFVADKAIRDYFHEVPASSYTKNTKPGVTLPVIATVKFSDGTSADVKLFVTFDDQNLTQTVETELSDIVPEGAHVTKVHYDTQLLGRENVSDSSKVERLDVLDYELPSTGDNSNILFFAALLMVSVIGMVVVSKKKAAC